MTFRAVLTALVLLGAPLFLGCSKVPLTPRTPVPAGSVVFRFTRAVRGPVEFTLDGARIPVQQLPKGAISLQVKGLTPGKHRYFLTSQRETFSPDTGELDLPADKGLYVVTLTQKLDSVLYGKPDPLPPAEGLPGVTAVLLK
ncbi:MAG: hypothetical protein KA743_10780 [Geothrix sp.]|jgi:hypothetical protein|uniref:Uncharacterized protein n=1 Tax=Candidatus Geothrix odensensis TaxID=2954440 RepID=A0A936F0G5_9BACT|nr:hypothetical protein [Holophagaceae bacterium]MBK8571500.1 hypothetical protein [Candidatus Geothrix odensensis]MBP7618992.1 hypothetical protein [Geothrix sp.]